MSMPRLIFHGAARCVTGSCHRLEVGTAQILIDCGMFQGSKSEKGLNYRPFPFDARQIDAVILTHAHIDHSGLLPKLVKAGFAGPIHATAATADLCGVMLPDSAHIQNQEVSHFNRRARHRSAGAVTPIYDQDDVRRCLAQLRPSDYGVWFEVIPGVRARLWNAGHLLGSASVELEIDSDDAPLRLVFSGDIGPNSKLMHPDPEGPAGVDYAICESTYGDEARPPVTDAGRRAALGEAVRGAIHPNGVLIIPSFAVERAQELISDLAQLMAEGTLPRIPVFVDSPMATRATEVFAEHIDDLDGAEALARALHASTVRFTELVAESKALAQRDGFHIIIAASGMCEAGRIRHHLKTWLWRREATILFVGFQAVGTLGRILQEGASKVRIQGEEFTVNAQIRSIDSYSGHADGPQLAAWLRARGPIAKGVFLVHGEEQALAGLAARLDGIMAADAVTIPSLDAAYDLTPSGAVCVDAPPPRLPPEKVARLDWHNDASKLFLDINDALASEADEGRRAILIRRLRRAMEGAEGNEHGRGR